MTLKFKYSLTAACFTALLLPSLSQAAAIFTNLGGSPPYDITGGNFVGNDFVGDNAAEGDSFMPLSNAIFGSVSLALSCNIASCPDPYLVSLRNSTSDSPGSVIESFNGSGLTLGQLNVNNPLIVFHSLLMPTLTAGTQYWVTVSSTLNDSITWNWNSTGDMSDQAISTDGGATYFSPSGLTPGALQIDSAATTATPEPATAVLLLAALPLALLARKFAARLH